MYVRRWNNSLVYTAQSQLKTFRICISVVLFFILICRSWILRSWYRSQRIYGVNFRRIVQVDSKKNHAIISFSMRVAGNNSRVTSWAFTIKQYEIFFRLFFLFINKCFHLNRSIHFLRGTKSFCGMFMKRNCWISIFRVMEEID